MIKLKIELHSLTLQSDTFPKKFKRAKFYKICQGWNFPSICSKYNKSSIRKLRSSWIFQWISTSKRKVVKGKSALFLKYSANITPSLKNFLSSSSFDNHHELKFSLDWTKRRQLFPSSYNFSSTNPSPQKRTMQPKRLPHKSIGLFTNQIIQYDHS